MEKLTEAELKDLRQVFTFARQAVVNDRNNLIAILNLEENIMKKLSPTFTEKVTKDLTHKKPTPKKRN